MNHKEYTEENLRRFRANRLAWNEFDIDVSSITFIRKKFIFDNLGGGPKVEDVKKDVCYLVLNKGWWGIEHGRQLDGNNNIFADAVFEIQNLPGMPPNLIEKLPSMSFCGNCDEEITEEQGEEYNFNYHYECRP